MGEGAATSSGAFWVRVLATEANERMGPEIRRPKRVANTAAIRMAAPTPGSNLPTEPGLTGCLIP